MEFKEALGIKDTSWRGIGKHLGIIVQSTLKQVGRNPEALVNFLKIEGHHRMSLDYVNSYLTGEASFGVFFPQIRQVLEIPPSSIFQSTEKTGHYLEELEKYLSTLHPESLVDFLKHKPGKEMREHVSRLLSKKRAEARKKQPVYTLEVCLEGKEEKRENEALPIALSLLSLKKYIPKVLKAFGEDETEISQELDEIEYRLKKTVCKEFEGEISKEAIKNLEIEISPFQLRKKKGYMIDFYYPEDYFDKIIAENSWMSLEAWEEAYTKGTFSQITDIQQIGNLGFAVGCGVDDLVDVRVPTGPEKYEIHQRWAHNGGFGRPGVTFKQLEAVEKGQIPVPEPPPEEDVIYEVNSKLTIDMVLFDCLPELVKDNPRLYPPKEVLHNPKLI